MSTGWENHVAAPIEEFHSQMVKRFHEVAKTDHDAKEKAFGKKLKKIDGNEFNSLLAEFKVKVMKAYGINSDAIPVNIGENPPLVNENQFTPIEKPHTSMTFGGEGLLPLPMTRTSEGWLAVFKMMSIGQRLNFLKNGEITIHLISQRVPPMMLNVGDLASEPDFAYLPKTSSDCEKH